MERSVNIRGLLGLFLGLVIILLEQIPVPAEERRVALLPWEFLGPSELSSKRDQLQGEVQKRLEGFGVTVLGPERLTPLGFGSKADAELILRLQREFGVNTIVEGSLTSVGQSFSLDGRIIRPGLEKPFHFRVLPSEELGDLAKKVSNEILELVEGVKKVVSIEVIGNQRIEKDAILAVIKTKKGERLDGAVLDEDIRAIYKMGYFEDVTVEAQDTLEGIALNIKVVEKPSIGKIVFKGNKKISEEDLLKEFGIKQHSIYDEKKLKDGINRLKELYKKKGYYKAEFDYTISTLPNNQLELKVNIKEGEKIYITNIEFIGNKVFSSGKLKKVMETSEKGFFSWLTDSGILDKKKLDYDVQKVAAFYHNHGYINARVGEPKVEYTEKGIKITMEIFEGEKYTVRSVELKGDIVVDEALLRKRLQMKKGDVFNREKLRSDVMTLMEVTVDEGYANAEVVPDISQDDRTHEVEISYRINKGEKVRIHRIEVSGNTNTRDKVIRREMQIQEGEFYSGSRLKESIERLNRLGFFEEVESQIEKLPEPDQVDLKIKIKEGHTGSLSFGGGYSSEVRGFIMTKISQQNFLGLGQTLTLSGRVGGRGTEFDLSFLEPWLFDRPVSFSTNAYRSTTEYDDFDRRSLGFGVGLGFPLRGLDRFTRGSIRYGLDSSDIFNLHPNASLAIRDMEGKNLTSSLSFGIGRDTRNRAWNPSKGSI
ncbi:MAG: outer membrane protein assembly factor BamA, partial [Desulfatiglandales bacterium]